MARHFNSLPRNWSGCGIVLTALLLLMAPGCASQPYVPGYYFYPQPATVEVYHRGAGPQTPLTVLASVLGVRRADPEHHIPYSMAVRLRLENNGDALIQFDPHSMELVTGTLRAFGPPLTNPVQPVDLAPGQRPEVTAYFPFPPGTTVSQINLDNLRLRWEVRIDNYSVQQTAIFERTAPDYSYDTGDQNFYY